jgi:hypothetical protein
MTPVIDPQVMEAIPSLCIHASGLQILVSVCVGMMPARPQSLAIFRLMSIGDGKLPRASSLVFFPGL